MPNEITPGMNTQARNPSFGQGGGGIIPEAPGVPIAPVVPQEPKTIREYLDNLKLRNAALDANSQMVPTFTNVAGQTGQFGPENAAVFSDIGRHGEIIGKGGPGVIQEEQPNPADKPVVGTDPYDMAQERLKHMLPDIWKATFGNRDPQAQITEAESATWQNKVQAVNNALVKKYEGKISKSHAQALKMLKDGYTPESINKYKKSRNVQDLAKGMDVAKVTARAISDFEKLDEYADADKIEAGEDAFIKGRLDSTQRHMESYASRMAADDAAKGKAGNKGSLGSIPPELQGQAEQMMADVEKLMNPPAGDPNAGNPMDVATVKKAMALRYPELVPYF